MMAFVWAYEQIGFLACVFRLLHMLCVLRPIGVLSIITNKILTGDVKAWMMYSVRRLLPPPDSAMSRSRRDRQEDKT